MKSHFKLLQYLMNDKRASRTQTDTIVHWIGHSQTRFDELLSLFLKSEYRVTQRAAWPLSYCARQYPELIKKHFGKLITHLKRPGLPPAVKRNTVRIFAAIELPVRYHGEIIDTCFRFIQSPDEPVAVKAFSLAILENLLSQYPDIKNELKLVIEERWNHETAAFHSRARKILKKL